MEVRRTVDSFSKVWEVKRKETEINTKIEEIKKMLLEWKKELKEDIMRIKVNIRVDIEKLIGR